MNNHEERRKYDHEERQNYDGVQNNRGNINGVSYSLEMLQFDFPGMQLSVHISEALHTIQVELTRILTDAICGFKGSQIYHNNKLSFRYLLKIISSPSEIHFKLACTSLSTIPLKLRDIPVAINNLNDSIRLLRHHEIHPIQIACIKTGNPEFDDSQASNVYTYF